MGLSKITENIIQGNRARFESENSEFEIEVIPTRSNAKRRYYSVL
jgi:hypothetical protein